MHAVNYIMSRLRRDKLQAQCSHWRGYVIRDSASPACLDLSSRETA